MRRRGGPPWDDRNGHRLTRLREGASLEQEDLAALVGVNQTTISKWERAAEGPTWERIDSLCKHLGCERRDMLADTAKSMSAEQKEIAWLKERIIFYEQTITRLMEGDAVGPQSHPQGGGSPHRPGGPQQEEQAAAKEPVAARAVGPGGRRDPAGTAGRAAQ